MNKTEFKKLLIKEVITMLESKFDIEFNGCDEGGRLGFEVNGFAGEFCRRDLSVSFWDTITLGGSGWSKEELKRQRDAVELDTEINNSIKSLVEYLQYNNLAFQD